MAAKLQPDALVRDDRKPATRVRAGALHAALKDVADVVAGKDTSPILNHVRLAAGDARIEVTATNLDMWAVRELASDDRDAGAGSAEWLGSIKPFVVALPAKPLVDLVGEIDGDAMLTLTAPSDGETRATIAAGKARFKLACLPVDDFPLPPPVGSEAGFSLPCSVLADALAAVEHAVSTEETRYYLNGVYLHTAQDEGSPQELRLAATDGHKLARLTLDPPDGAASWPGMIVSRHTVKLLDRLLASAIKAADKGEASTPPEIGIDAGGRDKGALLYFELPASDGGDITVTAKTIDGDFPDYTRVIPAEPPLRAVIGRAALAEVAKRVGVLASDKTRAVRLALSEGKATLSVRSPELGEASEEIECLYLGPDIELGFNGTFLREVLGAIASDQVALRFFEDAAGPVRIAGWVDDAESGALLQVLMPMRVA